jgi:hypothetical protein
MIVQKASKQTKIKSVQSSASTTNRKKIAEKQSRQVAQKQSRKTISKINARKTSVDRKKASKEIQNETKKRKNDV